MLKLTFFLVRIFKRILTTFKGLIQIISSLYEIVSNNFIKPFKKFIRLNLLPIIYFYCLFYLISIVKFSYINKIASFLVNSGYIKTYLLLNLAHPLLYSTGIAISLLIILIKVPSFQRNIYKYSFTIFVCFCFLGFSLLIFNIFEPLSLIFFVLYGSLIATVFGLYRIKNRPHFIDNKEINPDIKLELIKIRISNWWRGLSLLTNILIALFITALVSWVLNPPPENAKVISDYTLKSSFILFMSALPGLIYIYLKILRQINYLEKCVLELGIMSDESTLKGS